MKIYDNFLKQAHRIDARALALSDSMLEALEASIATITAKIAELQVKHLSADDFAKASITKRTKFLEAMAQEIRDIVALKYNSDIQTLINNALLDADEYSKAQTDKTLDSIFNADLDTPRLTLTQVLAWQNVTMTDNLTMTEWLKRLETSTAETITRVGRQAMAEGASVAKMSSMLREQGIQATRPKTDALSRTFLLSASNAAREASIQELAEDLNYQWLYVSTLDNRTCVICGASDGKIFDKDEPRPAVPRHVNCRCLYVPHFEEFPSFTRPSTKWDERTVNHRDGSTSTKFSVDSSELTSETYSAWLKRQLKEDPDFVRSILGKTRFELFSKGKITLNGMVSDGIIKNLSEL